jgi:hypothetical protein
MGAALVEARVPTTLDAKSSRLSTQVEQDPGEKRCIDWT